MLRRRIRNIFKEFEPFNYQLSSVEWFGETVIWLAPEPANVFIELTHAIVSAFPNYPPPHEVVVPYLTLGIDHSAQHFTGTAQILQAELPIRATAFEVLLMTSGVRGSHWTVAERFSLGRVGN